MERKATFGAGCFWGVEAAFRQVDGVTKTEVGYEGGTLENPTYEDVCSHTTGHAEVVQVTYDPERISYERAAPGLLGQARPDAAQPPGLGRRRPVPLGRSSSTTRSRETAASSKAERAAGRYASPSSRDRARADVLRRRGLSPAVPREARPLELHPGARRERLASPFCRGHAWA